MQSIQHNTGYINSKFAIIAALIDSWFCWVNVGAYLLNAANILFT